MIFSVCQFDIKPTTLHPEAGCRNQRSDKSPESIFVKFVLSELNDYREGKEALSQVTNINRRIKPTFYIFIDFFIQCKQNINQQQKKSSHLCNPN